ncbi:MAG: N-acetyl-gamma-glutamyl-phosphate reductase [Dehalococcoidia bacterium]
MARVGIINVTGYGGVELARLLHHHPQVELVSVTGRGAVGQDLAQVFPHLADIPLKVEGELGEVDLAFSALPHKASVEALLPIVRQGVKVVDISADLRLKKQGDYELWYDYTHPAPELLSEAVYGLPELRRKEIAASSLVANPGCYPTSAILALAPVVREGLIGPDIIIDAKSGVSGAGRTLGLGTHYSEVNENFSAYSLEGHRHLPEIEQELGALGPGAELSITFVPHLAPMTRGIFSTCYARPREGGLAPGEKGREELRALYRKFYLGEPFVKVVDAPPQTKQTWGSNLCLIYPTVDLRTGKLVIVSCLDNLVKGAAGQAIQNMNLMLGFPETTGLEALAVYP